MVPGAALSEVEKICSDCDQAVSITEGRRHVTFQIGSTVLVARRLEGEFLNYRQTIPQNNSISVEADTKTLQVSIDRASLIINDKLKSPLRCKFEDGSLSITSRTAIGSAFDRCEITGDGKGLEIGFNNRFLMDAVKAAPADRVRLELNTPTSPCLILPVEGKRQEHTFSPHRALLCPSEGRGIRLPGEEKERGVPMQEEHIKINTEFIKSDSSAEICQRGAHRRGG